MILWRWQRFPAKGQITIPVSVRNALKLKAGDKIVILEENGRFRIRGRNAGLHEGNPEGSEGY